MKKNLFNAFIYLFFISFFCCPPIDDFGAASSWAQVIPHYPEGKDFAAQVLRSPWTMSAYSEISQYINHSGQADYLRQISVANGVFSALSTATADAQFYPLFPGYLTAMLIGKVGHNYPIRSGEYRYLYLALKVDSRAPSPPDMFTIFWFADERQNGPGGIWGYSAQALYPDTPIWKLYKVDLNASGPGISVGGTPWAGNPTWQGLRIDPTVQADVSFQVDWVRLTDGTPVLLPVTFNAGNGSSIWIRPAGTTRELLVQADISSPYNLDLQGLPPGEYTYLVKNGGAVIRSGDFVINQAPVVHFLKPSPTGSQDYATLAGNPWDMSDGSDARVECAAHQFQNGMLSLSTPTGNAQPDGCWGGTYLGSRISDARLQLNTPLNFKPGDYRYLSFRLYTDGPWQDLVRGMMARWIWTIPGPGGNCHFISHDIPFDVGWQTYTIDLFDAFNGTPEVVSGGCPITPWKNAATVIGLRFDPNENILGYPLNQTIDWIRLYKEDLSARGTPFPIKIYLNKPPAGVIVNYYYTSDPQNQPTQHLAQSLESANALFQGPHTLFLPMLFNQFDPDNLPPANSMTFTWDTSQVLPGAYYICVSVDDSINQTTHCSETPALVL